MVPDPLDSISLRLLRLFEAIYRTRSISQAADALRTSQPSVSVSLSRLRLLFEDALFVRAGLHMEPTARANELIDGVRSILLIAGDHFVRSAPFEPASSDRCFTLHMADPGETIVLPRLMYQIALEAPSLRLRVRRIGDDSQSMLASGEVDLVIGYLSREAEGLRQRKLHDERYVCIARSDHPRISKTLGLEQFKSETHIVAAIAGTGHARVEPGFGQLKIDGTIALELSNYFAVGAVVARTDLIAVVPERLGAELAAQTNIRAFELPVKSPVYQVRQYWHPRSDHDLGNRWIRDLIVNLVNAYPATGNRIERRQPQAHRRRG